MNAAVKAEVKQDSGWWSGGVTCQLCGWKWVAVWPDKADAKALQCPKCGEMAGMPEPEAAS